MTTGRWRLGRLRPSGPPGGGRGVGGGATAERGAERKRAAGDWVCAERGGERVALDECARALRRACRSIHVCTAYVQLHIICKSTPGGTGLAGAWATCRAQNGALAPLARLAQPVAPRAGATQIDLGKGEKMCVRVVRRLFTRQACCWPIRSLSEWHAVS